MQAFDPEAMEEVARIYGDKERLQRVGSADETLENADAKDRYDGQVIWFQPPKLYQPKVLEEKGIAYYAIGRSKAG